MKLSSVTRYELVHPSMTAVYQDEVAALRKELARLREEIARLSKRGKPVARLRSVK